MIRNEEDRKDLIQDIYLKTYSHLSGFSFRSKLSTWIARIAYNTCLNYLQKKKYELLDDAAGFTEQEDDELPYGIVLRADEQTDRWLLDKQRAAIVQQAIEAQPPLFRTLITLYHQEELSYEEIMNITGLPAGTVKNYLFRARKKLKDHLLQQFNKEEI